MEEKRKKSLKENQLCIDDSDCNYLLQMVEKTR